MDSIYIGLSAKKKWTLGGSLIKWGENTDYHHVYIRRESSRVGNYVYQATFSGVNFMGQDLFLEQNEIIEEYEFYINDISDLVRFFVANAGRKYSMKQIVVLAGVILSDKLGTDCDWSQQINGDEKYICSELGGKILREFAHIDDIPKHLDMVTPRRLRPYLVQYSVRRTK